MLKWTTLLVLFGAMAGGLAAMGVGTKAILMMIVTLSLMAGASLLIAWPFLRRRAQQETEPPPEPHVNGAPATPTDRG